MPDGAVHGLYGLDLRHRAGADRPLADGPGGDGPGGGAVSGQGAGRREGMMPEGQRYRMLEGIDWAALDGQQVEIQSSLNWLTLRTKAGQVLTFGQAMKPLVPRGKAAAVEPPAERHQELEASNGTGLVDQSAGQESGRGP